jgi:ATP-binding cassette subfamily B (MDR/TAP) protein 1
MYWGDIFADSTHRSTIRHADVIFVIEDGKIVEIGTHKELQRLRGRYFATCLAQSLNQA